MQHDFGPPGALFRWRDGVSAVASGFPARGCFFPRAPRSKRDLIGYHECRIKTYAKLANEVSKSLGRWAFLDPLPQLLGPGLRNGADVGHQFFPTHSDA